jgi:hypothetical protein
MQLVAVLRYIVVFYADHSLFNKKEKEEEEEEKHDLLHLSMIYPRIHTPPDRNKHWPHLIERHLC